jgi:hypothetical protein
VKRAAVRVVFAPLFGRFKTDRARGLNVHGTASGRTITLDPRSSEIVKTCLHELIHLRNPGWSEEAVVTETAIRYKRMGWKEKARLLQLIGRGTIEGEDS